MAVTINDIADGIEARLRTITGLRVYSEIDEKSEPGGTELVAANVMFRERRQINVCGSQQGTFVVELSVPAEQPGWSRAIRRVREYLDDSGDRSVELAIENDKTLGGLDRVDAVISAIGPERRVKFADGWRWVGEVTVDVLYPGQGA